MTGRSGAQRPSVAELLARSEGGQPSSRTRRVAPSGRRGRRRKVWRRVIGGFLALVLLIAVYYLGLFAYVDNAVERSDVLRLSGPEIITPERQLDARNYLLVGADGGERDTTILAHLPADDSPAVVVVFPGNAYVDVPTCEDADGQPTEPYSGPFSSVVGTGGAGCLVRTVQGLTGLRVNHFVRMDLVAFPDMVDAIGGVPMCLGSPVREPASGLDLPAGAALIDGDETLPFLRQQTGQGQAETARIERQQQFLAALLDRSLSARTVANPVRITRFLTAAAGSLVLDPDTTLGDLKTLVELLRDLDSESVVLVTAPIADPAYTPVGSSSSYALLDEALGRQLYQSLIEDTTTVLAPDPAAGSDASQSEEISCG